MAQVFPPTFLKKCQRCRKLVRQLGQVFGEDDVAGLEMCASCCAGRVGVDLG